ncbi:MAG: hypothetical protein IPO90_07015 [Flavobacteriales bacterium]|nr:hypothetical protein [Flavobacteriales bacterium]
MTLLVIIGLFVVYEWSQRSEEHALRFGNTKWPGLLRVLFCYVIAFTTLWYGGAQSSFIYFHF